MPATKERQRKPPGKNAAKWNWPPILEAVDSGMPLLQVAEKFSVPIGSLRCKVGEVRKALALEARKVGFRETGEPAALPQPTEIVAVTEKNPEIPSIPAELTESQLLTLLGSPEAVLSLSASEAEKLMARALQLKVARGLAAMRDPESPKELGPMAKLFREMSGLTGDKGKGGSGLLSPQRSYGRRAMVIEASVVREEPEGGWPEGM